MNSTQTIAFYNLENLFDPEDGEHTRDANFTPNGTYRWNQGKYRRKIASLGNVISKIGPKHALSPPALLGVCEVENATCLQDLADCGALSPYQYDFVHFESNDRRGLDTALLYRKNHFQLLGSQAYRIEVTGQNGMEPTRDILHVEGLLFDEHLHVLVNHWPSRLEGSRATRSKRREMARELDRVVGSIYARNPNSKILILGDFNEQPEDYPLRNDFTHNFFNALNESRFTQGTTRFKNKWVIFDQILIGQNMLVNRRFNFVNAGIYDPPYLIETQGRHKGSPKRSFRGKRFQNGFSDHFPVYAVFNVNH